MGNNFWGYYNGKIVIVESEPRSASLKRFYGNSQEFAWIEWRFNRYGRVDRLNALLPDRGVCIMENIDGQEEWHYARFLCASIPKEIKKRIRAYSGSRRNRLRSMIRAGHAHAFQLVESLKIGGVGNLKQEYGFRPLTELTDDNAIDILQRASLIYASLRFLGNQVAAIVGYENR